MNTNNLFILDKNTGENLGQINDIEDITIASECKIDYLKNEYGNQITKHNPTHTMSFNIDKPIITKNFYKLFGVDTAKSPDTYDIQIIKYVQARKHKKRRINKKWLKRYGYKQMVLDSKGWRIKSNTNGTIELIK